jgi:hypothetical protein
LPPRGRPAILGVTGTDGEATMIRTAIGAAVGGTVGLGATFVFEYLTSPAGIGARGERVGVVAVLAAMSGCAAGAIVGGVADILAFLRRALPPHASGAEGDYGDDSPG